MMTVLVDIFRNNGKSLKRQWETIQNKGKKTYSKENEWVNRKRSRKREGGAESGWVTEWKQARKIEQERNRKRLKKMKDRQNEGLGYKRDNGDWKQLKHYDEFQNRSNNICFFFLNHCK